MESVSPPSAMANKSEMWLHAPCKEFTKINVNITEIKLPDTAEVQAAPAYI